MSTWSLRAAPIIAAIIFLAGCSSAPDRVTLAGAAGPGQDITVAAIPAADLAGLYVALDEGLFAQQGLHVKIKKIASSQAVIAAQLNGQVDIGAGSYVPYIAAQAAGARFRILAEASTLRPDSRALVVPANSNITTIAGLAGHKIGVNGTNSIGTLLISALLQENGISPKKVDFVTDKQGFPAMPGQLQKGAWQAAFLAEPYVTIAGEQYGDQELADLDQGATEDFPIQGYAVTAEWARKYPGTLKAFTTALDQGQQVADTDRAAVEAVIEKYLGIKKKAAAFISLPAFPLGVDAVRLQRVVSSMVRFGLLPKGTRFSVGSMVAG